MPTRLYALLSVADCLTPEAISETVNHTGSLLQGMPSISTCGRERMKSRLKRGIKRVVIFPQQKPALISQVVVELEEHVRVGPN